MVFEVLDSAGLVVLLVVLALCGLLIRRAVLRRNGAALYCAIRVGFSQSTRGWHLGVVRYTPQHLQWFRIVSAAPHAKFTLVRRSIEVVGRREPRGYEHSITHAVVVAQCRALTRDGRELDVELAMGEAAMTGFLSWLESAPPGAHQNRGLRRG